MYLSEWAIVSAGPGSLLLIALVKGIEFPTHCSPAQLSQLSAYSTAILILRLVLATLFLEGIGEGSGQ